MAKEKFINWNPSKKSKLLLLHINDILNEYEKQGYRLTLRQLYYQLVSRDIIANNVREYAKIGSIVSNGRLAGLIDWYMIEDRMRTVSVNAHWSHPAEIIRTASRSFYRSRWENQQHYLEVWCEKDAVSNILEPVCSELDVLFLANRGYLSQSAMYQAYQRFCIRREEYCHLIYLGDHDPSGMDMTRDITERINMMTGETVNVKRIALNMNQVEEYNPPENPAKITDSRYQTYAVEYGTSSWELDALEPRILSELLHSTISQFINFDSWKKIEEQEEKEKDQILRLAKQLEN